METSSDWTGVYRTGLEWTHKMSEGKRPKLSTHKDETQWQGL